VNYFSGMAIFCAALALNKQPFRRRPNHKSVVRVINPCSCKMSVLRTFRFPNRRFRKRLRAASAFLKWESMVCDSYNCLTRWSAPNLAPPLGGRKKVD